MKIAIVHDYIKEYGGAERVLEALHEVYPDAPVYTSVYLPKFLGPHRARFTNWNIKTSFLQYVPFKAKLISPMRLLAPLAFLSFDFSDYDVVIVSATGAYTPNFIRRKFKVPSSKFKISSQKLKDENANNYTLNAKHYFPVHICYCHTPPRYLYGYATARDWQKNPFLKAIGILTSHFLRMIDALSAKRVDYFIANSEEVKQRIKKFYRRDAVVIYPPVDIQNSTYQVASRQHKNTNYSLLATDYYVAGGRLARPKHIDLIIQACAELGVPLKIFGKGFAGYGQELKSQISKVKNTSQNSKIEFVDEVNDAEKFDLMRNAKAYIFASEDEDFGITPVEAMAAGTPVVAYRSGGVKETVVDGKTGVFFDKLTVDSLTSAMKQLENLSISKADCLMRAEKFGKERFKKEIGEFVEKTLHSNI